MINIKDIKISLNEIKIKRKIIINPFECILEFGKIYGLVGANGSGKTVFLKKLMFNEGYQPNVKVSGTVDRIGLLMNKSYNYNKQLYSLFNSFIDKEVIDTFDLLLEDRSIVILAYNIETVIAEKFETILTRGITNTRMRDFYDIYILVKLQGHRIENVVLGEAVRKTAEKRGSVSALSSGQAILDEVRFDAGLQRHWLNYQRKNSYADDISWEDINVLAYGM